VGENSKAKRQRKECVRKERKKKRQIFQLNEGKTYERVTEENIVEVGSKTSHGSYKPSGSGIPMPDDKGKGGGKRNLKDREGSKERKKRI